MFGSDWGVIVYWTGPIGDDCLLNWLHYGGDYLLNRFHRCWLFIELAPSVVITELDPLVVIIYWTGPIGGDCLLNWTHWWWLFIELAHRWWLLIEVALFVLTVYWTGPSVVIVNWTGPIGGGQQLGLVQIRPYDRNEAKTIDQISNLRQDDL